jgi:hypothetical protein
VSAATGAAFQGPQDTRRTDGNLDVWEGLCGSCGEWIALVSSKKKGTTWFRHAYKVFSILSAHFVATISNFASSVTPIQKSRTALSAVERPLTPPEHALPLHPPRRLLIQSKRNLRRIHRL